MKRSDSTMLAVAALFVGAASPAVAAPPGSPLIEALAKCLDIADDKARLACTDVAARKLVAASRGRDVVVLDREEVAKTRSSLFGFTLPRLALFDRDDDNKGGKPARDTGADRLDATIVRAVPGANGLWTLTLTGDAMWQTTEGWTGPVDPRAGQAIVVKRGAFGGYIVVVAGGRPVRARRTG